MNKQSFLYGFTWYNSNLGPATNNNVQFSIDGARVNLPQFKIKSVMAQGYAINLNDDRQINFGISDDVMPEVQTTGLIGLTGNTNEALQAPNIIYLDGGQVNQMRFSFGQKTELNVIGTSVFINASITNYLSDDIEYYVTFIVEIEPVQ